MHKPIVRKNTASNLTCLKSWNLERTAFKEIQFSKRKNGLPGPMVSPTILCLYAFLSLESSNRLRKSWKNPKNDQVFPVRSKLSLRREICVSFESWFLIFILGQLVNWIITNFFLGQENITILHWNNETFRDESLNKLGLSCAKLR